MIFQRLEPKKAQYYWQTQVEYLFGMIAISEKQRDAAAQKFTASKRLVLKAIKEKGISEALGSLDETYI